MLDKPKELPIWSESEVMRLLGVRDGYIHAICDLKIKIGHINYDRIDPRFVRQVRQREAILKPMRDLLQKFEADFHSVQAAYKMQRERRDSAFNGGQRED